MQKKGKFDYILLETTGLADPGAVSTMFWVDAELGSDVYLDGIISVIDAKYGMQHLTEEKPEGLVNEAARQIALGDLIIINKTDLVQHEELVNLKTAVRSINGLAKLIETQRSRVELAEVLDLHAFDGQTSEKLQERFCLAQTTEPHLDKSIVTVTFEVSGTILEEDLNLYIQNLLWEKQLKNNSGNTMEIIRLKGIVSIKEKPHQMIVQGVHELYEIEETFINWSSESERINRFVFIGRNLDKEILEEVFATTVLKQGVSNVEF
ncbi:zinc-regulated GTPase metalloprotein activator 1 isoform X3 [Narcine bancroftii]